MLSLLELLEALPELQGSLPSFYGFVSRGFRASDVL